MDVAKNQVIYNLLMPIKALLQVFWEVNILSHKSRKVGLKSAEKKSGLNPSIVVKHQKRLQISCEK